MDIDKMTIGDARNVASMFGGTSAHAEPCPFEVGKSYLIRTVTFFWVGRVARVVGAFLVLDDASWVADTGRYHKATSVGALKEVEPIGRAYVGMGSIVDARDWTGDLPSDAK